MSIQGKVVVFTGKISKPRHEFQRLVEEHGGIAGGDVTKSTDYLVVGEKPGSKLVRATMLGVQTISEDVFLKLLEEPEAQTPTAETLKETQERLLEQRYCYFCKRYYNEFKTLPDYDTCILCEVAYKPKCPKCGSTNVEFSPTCGKLYECQSCEHWFKAPYKRQGPISLSHYWFRKTVKDNGDIVEDCLCGTVKITHPNGTWEKHEPRHVIEQARKISHAHAVQEERKFRVRQEEDRRRTREEAMVLKQLETLNPFQLTQLEDQLKEKGVKNESL